MSKKPDESKKDALARKQEENRLRLTGRDIAAMAPQDLQRLIQELQLYQIELEMQNEELCQAQVEIGSARDRYQSLYNFSPVGHLALDRRGAIVEANLTAGTLLGVGRKELMGQPLAQFIARDDQDLFHRQWQEALKSGARQIFEIHPRIESGPCARLHLESTALYDESGHIACWQLTLLNISELESSKEGLRLFRTLLDQAEDSIEVIDPATGRFLNCNEKSFSSLGYTRQEFLSLSVPDIDPVVTAPIFRQIAIKLRNGGTETFDTLHRRKDGSTFPVEVKVRLLQLDREYLIAIVRDITERKKAEEEIRIRNVWKNALLNYAGHAIIATTPNGIIQTFNPAAERMLGYRAEEMIDKLSPAVIHDPQEVAERADIFSKELGERIEPGFEVFVAKARRNLPNEHEWTYIRKDGTRFPVLLSVTSLQHENGTIAGFLGMALDITDRKALEKALVESHDRLEQHVQERTEDLQHTNRELQKATSHLSTILERSPLAIIELDEAGRVRRWNDAATQTFGWTEEEMLGRDALDLVLRQDEESNRLWTSIVKGTSQQQQQRELRCRKHDGTLIDVSFVSATLSILDASLSGTIVFLSDVTERKRLEAQYRQAQKMEAIGQLAGGVAHDFNNLLTVIIGQSSLLLDQLPPQDPRHEMAETTLQASERAAELTKQMLTFSRQQIFTKRPTNLNDSISTVSAMLRSMLGETIALTTDLAPDLWTILSDRTQIDQIVMNLTINARDAMPNGGSLAIATRNLTVPAEAPASHRMLPSGDYVHLRVQDSGFGMSQETLSHLFEPFFTTKEVGKGTGLGLATVYGIVTQSQGYIFVMSELGQGATFDLYFPRIMATVAQPSTLATRPPRESKTVLVVEDQDQLRGLLVAVLAGQGYRVQAASNGEEALRLAKTFSEPIQVLVTDVVMPGMQGPVLAAQLRRLWPELRVLFISGYTDSEETLMLNDPGATYIQKPFKPDALTNQLRELLDMKEKKSDRD